MNLKTKNLVYIQTLLKVVTCQGPVTQKRKRFKIFEITQMLFLWHFLINSYMSFRGELIETGSFICWMKINSFKN